MERINTYKALTNNVLLFGFQLADLAICLVVVVLVMGFTDSPIASGVILIILLVFFRKMRNRTAGYFKSFFSFLATPCKLSVKNGDILSYKEALKCRK